MPRGPQKGGITSTQRTGNLNGALPQQRADDALPVVPAPTPSTVPVSTPPRPSQRDIAAIKASLTAVQQRPVALAEMFYEHLFEIAPDARAMFADDMTAQMQRMTDMLLATLGALQNDAGPDRADDTVEHPALERSLHALGAWHRDRWDVVPEHYLYIAHALTRAVRDVAGPAWSGSLSSSWIALTQWITGHMLVGHHQSAPGR
jgi:hemoglobin-like flavoprotein